MRVVKRHFHFRDFSKSRIAIHIHNSHFHTIDLVWMGNSRKHRNPNWITSDFFFKFYLLNVPPSRSTSNWKPNKNENTILVPAPLCSIRFIFSAFIDDVRFVFRGFDFVPNKEVFFSHFGDVKWFFISLQQPHPHIVAISNPYAN